MVRQPNLTRQQIEELISPFLGYLPIEQYPVIAFGIRGIYGENKRGVWDDANGFIERTPAGIFAIFPANTDPTVKYRNGVASLSSGQIAYFKIGLHKGRKAFRQASTFLVDRDGVGRGLSAPVSCALNWHDAPGYTTSSLGCQTNPKDVFPAVRELGYHLINKYYPKKQIIPYILVDGPRAFALAEQHQSAKEGGKSRPVCQAAIDIVKKSEGLRLKPYLCPAGKWTIGYGHTKNVTAETKEITTEIAEHLLAEDLAEFGNGVTKLLEVVTNDNEFGALVSLAYNIGLGNLANSTLLKELNLKNFDKAADQFLVWNKARNPKTKKLEVLAGLTKRRALERNLFLS